MLAEGKSKGDIALALGISPVSVGKVKTALAKEALVVAAAEKAASGPSEASKKATGAKADQIAKKLTKGVLEAFGFDPARTAEELADELRQVLDAEVEFDVERAIAAWVKAGEDLWVIGAKRGLDVSQIVRSIDRMKEGE